MARVCCWNKKEDTRQPCVRSGLMDGYDVEVIAPTARPLSSLCICIYGSTCSRRTNIRRITEDSVFKLETTTSLGIC